MTEWLSSIGPTVGNHLWQTTVFAAVVWLTTLFLRRNQARVRYGLWLAASVKFLIPFSLLVTASSETCCPSVTPWPSVFALRRPCRRFQSEAMSCSR